MIAITVLWPAPVAFPVEARATAALRALAARIRAELAWVVGEASDELQHRYDEARAQADDAVAALDKLFLATPYRPTGLSTKARAEIRLVDELHWLSEAVLRSGMRRRPTNPDESICAVKHAAAEVLDCAASVLAAGAETAVTAGAELEAARARLREALHELERHATSFPIEQPARGENGHASAATVISALDPSFRTQELAYITEQIATNVAYAGAAAVAPGCSGCSAASPPASRDR